MAKVKPDMEEVSREMSIHIDDAIDFMETEWEPEWELAERYYRGESRLEETEGRSNVVKTEVRDAIRNTLPSVMRTLLQARKIVEFMPTSVQNAKWVEQQSEWCTQTFWACGGYMQIYNVALNALKLKIGPIKVEWEENPKPRHFAYTKVTEQFVNELLAQPNVSFEITKEDTLNGVKVFDLEGEEYYTNGRIRIEAVPPYEFFISRNATCIEDAMIFGVHGERRIVTVGEAIELGLDHDNWEQLDYRDPEESGHSRSSQSRRGYVKRDEMDSIDLNNHRFELTKAIARYDLIGSGTPQLYCFWFGGTQHELLDYEEIDDSPYEIGQIDPIPHSAVGRSLADITVPEQDTNTSLLRAVVDNAHAANNPRLAADPNRTSFDDLDDYTIGASIRSRGDTIQTVSIPFTGSGLLPLMQYLDLDIQSKTGVTKASQGLDPDAMQSTDKNAVMNTIQTGQSQVELMVRNLVETALIPIFRKLMRLSIAHQDPIQMLRTKGSLIPINMQMFNPDLVAVPLVGLGTASPMIKRAALENIYARQMQFMQTMGMGNPFTSYTQVYNTLEDMAELDGIMDVSRYFKMVTPGVEKKLAEAQAKAAEEQKKNAPADPGKTLVAIEQIKQSTKLKEVLTDATAEERRLALDALKAQEANDIARDKLAQERVIKLAEIMRDEKNKEIKEEQAANDSKSTTPASTTGSGSKDKTEGSGSKTG